MSEHDDPILQNCVLEICCEPEPSSEGLAAAAQVPGPSQRAIAALARLIATEAGSGASALDAARVVLTRFDLAARGTLLPLKQSIAAHARGPKYEG